MFFFYSSAAPAEVGVGGGGGGGGGGAGGRIRQPSGRQPHEKQPNRVRSGAEEEEAWQEVALGSRVHLAGSAAAARLLISFAGEKEKIK